MITDKNYWIKIVKFQADEDCRKIRRFKEDFKIHKKSISAVAWRHSHAEAAAASKAGL